MFSKKRLVVFGVAAVMAVTSCFAFAGCSGDDAKTEKASSLLEASKGSDTGEKKESVAQSSAEQAPDNSDSNAQLSTQQGAASQSAPEDTKYGDAEVYTNDNGKPAAKTESGVEVELSGENMKKLIEDYEGVKGSGSEEEQAILDQIQVLLEVTQNQDVSTK